ncbi:DUF2309 family protein [Rudanella paleaurantiibacter]|uniref:Probable inorganic carbon transporter subunit DabA n=1 Tax=Rudanella paleaurantiibacter TaxID=2614655 RepID=A0A7J5U165_9BACT|nr:DUF2309 family protein [Rudanella paleaurantiibacter]
MQDAVSRAGRVLAPVWPLKTFIACNPLQGLESMPFEQALREGTRLFGLPEISPALEAVNRQLIKWGHVFLDEGQATIPMPNRHLGFYAAWRQLAFLDDELHGFDDDRREWLKALPEAPEDAILLCLEALGVIEEEHVPFLSQSLAYLPGWSGYVKWRTEWQTPPAVNPNPITMTDWLAVRLAITSMLWPDAYQPTIRQALSPVATEKVEKTMIQLEQSEAVYRRQLLTQLLPQARQLGVAEQRPDAQLVFCIDVRSEPFRRRLEAQGRYETFGFAGFFGLPIRVHHHADPEAHDACPVLLKPRHEVHETPLADEAQLQRFQTGGRVLKGLKATYNALKYNFATPFALVETLGAACGLLMLGRTLAPVSSQRLRESLTGAIQPEIPTKPDCCATPAGISAAEQATYAETALRLMGLTTGFGKLVVFCGHGSTTQNNAYASALDCGACGGNHGGPNAQLMAQILNTPSVRQKLAQNGIEIPTDTVFMAAEHNTTTDEVTLYDEPLATTNASKLQGLQTALVAARRSNSANRYNTFGRSSEGVDTVGATVRRSADWAEVRPEWGLARNAAFIVGPRQLTRQVDLEGRCFLHSYEWESDVESKLLETILTAPMVVAQWINNQYLFSTLDNVAYGSGSKVTHNVAGKLGVMQGNASDLMHGLPLQSVFASDETRYHEPQRLLTVVYAPRYRIDQIIERQPVLQTLFFNGWVKLVAIEPTDNRAYRLDVSGIWQRLAF